MNPAAVPALIAALEDAHDALGEMMSIAQIDWMDLSAYTGNDSWVGLKQRVDAALAGVIDEAEPNLLAASRAAADLLFAMRVGPDNPVLVALDAALARWRNPA